MKLVRIIFVIVILFTLSIPAYGQKDDGTPEYRKSVEDSYRFLAGRPGGAIAEISKEDGRILTVSHGE